MVFDNSPAMGWVRMQSAIATFNNKIYIIPESSTEKKYIYWDSETPSIYHFSNILSQDTTTKFLVLINDNGQHTVVKSKKDNFNFSFDADPSVKIREKLYGLYDEFKNGENENETKFSNISQDITRIQQEVGIIRDNGNSISQNVTRLLQDANGFKQEIKNTEYKFESIKYKDYVLNKTLNAISSIGKMQMALESYPTNTPKNKIHDDDKELYSFSKNKLEEAINDYKTSIKDNDFIGVLKNKFPNIIDELDIMVRDIESAYSNFNLLYREINSSPQMTNINKSSLYEFLVNLSGTINAQKNTLLKKLSTTDSGNITEIIGNLFLDNKKGGFSFSKEINGLKTKQTELSVSLDGFNTTVSGISRQIEDVKNILRENQTSISQNDNSITLLARELRTTTEQTSSNIESLSARLTVQSNQIASKVSKDSFSSLIEQNANSVIIALNNEGRKYGSYSKPNFVFDENGLTVNKGFVATDTLTVPNGHNPYINLFKEENGRVQGFNGGKPAIDATFKNNTGFGDALRFKWNDDNYIKIAEDYFEVYLGNYGDRHDLNNNKPIFKVTNDELSYRGRTIARSYNVSPSSLTDSTPRLKTGFYYGSDSKLDSVNVGGSGSSGSVFSKHDTGWVTPLPISKSNIKFHDNGDITWNKSSSTSSNRIGVGIATYCDERYASKSHSHSEYASKSHSHYEYAREYDVPYVIKERDENKEIEKEKGYSIVFPDGYKLRIKDNGNIALEQSGNVLTSWNW